jgi:hypothetical protein
MFTYYHPRKLAAVHLLSPQKTGGCSLTIIPENWRLAQRHGLVADLFRANNVNNWSMYTFLGKDNMENFYTFCTGAF